MKIETPQSARWLHLLVVALLAALVTVPAMASFPPSAAAVNDAADLLSESELQLLRSATSEAATSHGLEVVVVIIDSVDVYDPGGQIEPFARALFDHRGIGGGATGSW
ncbi:MAG: TPM domain-containing protein [Thermoanaerobaculia bacterium]|nr:TPM domain-containing protein [Thermoanaerobaculia bacterium]